MCKFLSVFANFYKIIAFSPAEMSKNRDFFLTWAHCAAFVLLGGGSFAEGTAPHRGRVVANAVAPLGASAAAGTAP
jgi:hypothetical protein